MGKMIKEIPEIERPRERFLKYGVQNLNYEDLISIILRTGTKNISVKELSLNIISNVKNLRELNISMLVKIKGIGNIKAMQLISALELGRRVYYEQKLSNKINIKSSKDIFNYFKYVFEDCNQEKFYCIYLDSKKNIIEIKLLFMGTLNYSIVHPREIFKNAYLLSAASFICIHNHPSGDTTPSDIDISFTNELVNIGKLQKIPIVDHIIIGTDEYYSFFENGKI